MDVSINYLAVLVSAIVAMLLGMIYYGPLFGEKWMKLVGFTKAELEKKGGMGKSMLLGFISQIITALALAYFIDVLNYSTLQQGLMLGAITWFGFVATTTLGNVIWEKKPCCLYVLNNIYTLINFLVMGAILVSWQ